MFFVDPAVMRMEFGGFIAVISFAAHTQTYIKVCVVGC